MAWQRTGRLDAGVTTHPVGFFGAVRAGRLSVFGFGLWVLLCCMSFGSRAAVYDPEIESFNAHEMFPAKWLKGPGYEVDPDVINQDFMNHYRIASPFGRFGARGDAQLFVRIRELSALSALQEMNKSRVFVDSASNTVSTTVDNVSSAVENPSGLKSGFSRLMKRLKRMTRNAYRKTRSLFERDEDQAEEAAQAGQAMAKGILGVNRAYRELARDLRVDPYTRNGLLAREMESMAKVSAAGSLGVKSLMIPVLPLLYGAGYLLGVNNLIYDTHPIDLQLRNEEALRRMGISNALIKRLSDNKWHTLTTLTRITTSLERMNGVDGRQFLVRRAADVDSVGDAALYTQLTELLAIYHQKRRPIEAVVDGKRFPFGVTGRSAVVILPVDFLNWTPTSDALTQRLAEEIPRRAVHHELWVTGRISARARSELGARGWALFDQAVRRI